MYTEAEYRALAEVLENHPGIYVLSDEIYEHINFTSGHASMAAFDDMYDRTVTVNGVSKAFAMTGWRIGYIGAPAWIARACNKMQGQVTSGANCIAQRATIAALEAGKHVLCEARMARDAAEARQMLQAAAAAAEVRFPGWVVEASIAWPGPGAGEAR